MLSPKSQHRFTEWYRENTDGSILKGKIKGAIGNDKKSLKRAALVRTMFSRIDSNGSGEVEVPEMLQLSLDLGMEMDVAQMELIYQEMDLDGNGTIDFDEFTEWYQHKGGKGDELRRRLKNWYKQLSSESGDAGNSGDAAQISVKFDKGRALQGTKRVEGKITYFFSRISGAYSELCQFSARLTPREKTGFTTIDKLVYLQQTQLFKGMELGEVLRIAQCAEQVRTYFSQQFSAHVGWHEVTQFWCGCVYSYISSLAMYFSTTRTRVTPPISS